MGLKVAGNTLKYVQKASLWTSLKIDQEIEKQKNSSSFPQCYFFCEIRIVSSFSFAVRTFSSQNSNVVWNNFDRHFSFSNFEKKKESQKMKFCILITQLKET